MRPSEPAHPGAFASRWPVVLAWGLWALAMLGFAAFVWLDHVVRQAGYADALRADEALFALTVVTATTVGAVVATRKPRHPVGWLLLILGLSGCSVLVAGGYAILGLVARPGALPGAVYVAAYANGAVLLFPACIGFVLLLTPTGSLPSPWWRWWAWVAGTAPVVSMAAWLTEPFGASYEGAANPLAVDGAPGKVLLAAANVTGVVTVLSVPVAAGVLLARFRRAHGVERQQLRWVVFAGGLAATGVLVLLVGLASPLTELVVAGSAVFTGLPPLAIGAAVLRYRLYDLDRIVSRTVAYGLLTVLLGSAYAVVVLGLGQVLGRDRPSLAVAGATLAVAAAFQPARRRIQELVDRRFNRHKYDAERTIAAFSRRLRQQTDLDALTAELLGVVDQTMQPTRAALWLRPAAASGRGGARVRG